MSIEAIVFYLLVLDSVSCNLVAWFGEDWYARHFRIFSRLFPATVGWALYYFILVMWVGSLLWRMG
ncbi:MAG TPA: hypothetical protein VF803_02665, partial [Candidatus Paceibacterota bacterium]